MTFVKNKTMNKTIIEIEQLSTFVFEDKDYEKFLIFIQKKMYNDARLMLDYVITTQEEEVYSIINNLEYSIANRIVDLLIDLIEIDVDGDGNGKRIVKSIAGEQQ